MDPIVATALIFGSAWFFLFTLLGFWKSKRAATWPEVAGKVVSSKVEIESNGEDSKTYRPAILYEYTCEGRRYSSRDIFLFGAPTSTRRPDIEAICLKYPAGKEVAVRYNPKKPGRSVLEIEADKHVYFSFAMEILAFVVGLLFYPWQQ